MLSELIKQVRFKTILKAGREEQWRAKWREVKTCTVEKLLLVKILFELAAGKSEREKSLDSGIWSYDNYALHLKCCPPYLLCQIFLTTG